MNNIEILAPAGGFDSVIAAVRSGADAVYIGAKRFSARASAHNFDDEEMKECARYCHERDVRVYLALNTLIFDDEMEEALELVKTAARADIDAIIIQDLGLASLVKKAVPKMALHASTQMTVHTPYGARALYELGFKRVVVSRELSIDEIKEIREFCPEVELEVFVHGALCMCVSGQCYFSAMLGGRSANRGMCAQPCRLPMSFGGNDHALSLKDNGSLNYLRELESIGVRSAKIEGRMKRPEYVAAAVKAAKEARDNGRVSRESDDRLRAVFSRTGFTDGYLRGELGADMFGYRRRDDVVSADNKLLKDIRSDYKDERQSVEIDMSLSVKIGKKPTLTVSDGKNTVEAEGETPAERAVNVPLSRERAEANLRKTGGTQYIVRELSTDIEDGATAAISALNSLRREALKKLDEKRATWHKYEILDFDIQNELVGNSGVSEDMVCVNTLDYPAELSRMGRVYISLDGFGDIDDPRIVDSIKDIKNIGVEAPRVTFGNEKDVYDRLAALRKAGVERLLAHNIASAYIGRELGYVVRAGFGMNITNSYTLAWARGYGIADVELSLEIDLKRVGELKKAVPVGIVRYGHIPLMITRNSPAGGEVGDGKSCKNYDYLQDRKNERFPVIKRGGCCEIMNCVPLILPQEEYEGGEGVFNIYRFSVENSVEKMKNSIAKIKENRGFERFTRGLYVRGVKNFTIL